ncbi:abhydrolase domain-containing protein [Acephala macrosclerotiorum]|nr:abhydrolase domain-containing protein [Acephala macrosclerotiorum]
MTSVNTVVTVFKYVSISAAVVGGLYAIFLGLLTTSTFQAHAVYLHKIQMTWFKDLDVPEVFGFLRNQATPFMLKTSDGERLLAFKLLRDDPGARLILHMHGAGGTVGSGYRVPNYQALSAGQPRKIHVLTFDYRGFGRSSGTPTENGVLLDALTVVEWAINTAGIPPSRILIFAQSMGTAVSIAIQNQYAQQSPPVVFAGAVLVAPFVDIATLVSTYRVAGTIPILSPLAKFSTVFKFLQDFIRDNWSSKDRIAQYVRANEANGEKYRLTIIHAKDDYDVPWSHTPELFWYAVNATSPAGISLEELDEKRSEPKVDLGAAGSVMEWRTENGVIREEVLKTGLHDVIMGYPVITIAVMRMFQAVDSAFTC